jgi:hypothetical protein
MAAVEYLQRVEDYTNTFRRHSETTSDPDIK